MGLLVALGVFGLLVGGVIRNRLMAVLCLAAGVLSAANLLPGFIDTMEASPVARELLDLMGVQAAPDLVVLAGAAAMGLLIGWGLFGREAAQGDDRWDPDAPRRRRRRRRRGYA